MQTQPSVVLEKIFELAVEGVAERSESGDQQALELKAMANLVIDYCQARKYKRESLMSALNVAADNAFYFDDEYQPPVAEPDDPRFELMGCKFTCYCDKCVSWKDEVKGHCGLTEAPNWTRLSEDGTGFKCSGYVIQNELQTQDKEWDGSF